MIILLHIVRIVCITSPELQPMAVQYTGHVISDCITWQWYCTAIGLSSFDVIRTICYPLFLFKMQNKNLKIKIAANLRFSSSYGIYTSRFQIGCVFVEYDLYNISTTFIQNYIYMHFRINLTQFYINFSRQEHDRCLICIV